MAEKIAELDDASFDSEVIKSGQPVVVDFWAPWCGPCRAIAPIMEDLSQTYAGKVKFAKVNVDENVGVASRYTITAIPTLLFFKDGKVVNQIVGAVAKSRIVDVLDSLL